jgi:hypothetical protein
LEKLQVDTAAEIADSVRLVRGILIPAHEGSDRIIVGAKSHDTINKRAILHIQSDYPPFLKDKGPATGGQSWTCLMLDFGLLGRVMAPSPSGFFAIR